MPERIQLRRTKGCRKPEGVVRVDRFTKWGNPFIYRDDTMGLVRYQPRSPDVVDYEGRISANGTRHDYYGADGKVTEFWVRYATKAELVQLFRATLLDPTPSMRSAHPGRRGHFAQVTPDEIRAELAGHDLACWCKPGDPCHADVLLEIANGGSNG
jgi:hypothetical protein